MTRKILVMFVIIASCALVFYSQQALAQTSNADLRKEIESLKKEQEAIRKELQEIKRLLESRGAEPTSNDMMVDISNHPTQGAATAPLTLIEFSDYQCPFCTRFHTQTLPQIDTDYIKTGKLRRVYFDFPLEEMHRAAFKAAIAARCAGEQGKFFDMQERLLANFRTIEPVNDHATAVGLDLTAFTACMDSNRHTEAVRKDVATGKALGIEGTPHFILARTDPANPNRVAIITRINGARPFDNFKTEIEKALAGPTQAK